MKTESDTKRGSVWGVIKRGMRWFKLIGSAVASGPRERLGVLTAQDRRASQADAVIGGELSASWVVREHSPFPPAQAVL